jgi:hypothetical protein
LKLAVTSILLTLFVGCTHAHLASPERAELTESDIIAISQAAITERGLHPNRQYTVTRNRDGSGWSVIAFRIHGTPHLESHSPSSVDTTH